MNTRQQEYILAIAEEGTMQHASERLFISQSTLSQTLLKLEKELGCQLFIRTARKMIPTKEGEAYIEGARQTLDIKEKTYKKIHEMMQERRTTYRIGVSSHDGIERFLIASSELQRRIDGIEIYAVEDTYKKLLQKLEDNSLNLLITTWNLLSEIPFPFQVLSEEEIMLVASSGMFQNRISAGQGIAWEELKNEKFILTPQGTTLRNMTDAVFSKLTFTPKVVCELNHVPATLRMVEQKDVLAFLPKGLCKPSETLEYYSLIPKLIRYQLIVYNHETECDEVMQDFIHLLHNLDKTARLRYT